MLADLQVTHKLNILLLALFIVPACGQRPHLDGQPTQYPIGRETTSPSTQRSTSTQEVDPTEQFATPIVGDATMHLLELLNSNGGCRLPCLWGFSYSRADKAGFARLLDYFRQAGSSDLMETLVVTGDNASALLAVLWFDDQRMDIDLTGAFNSERGIGYILETSYGDWTRAETGYVHNYLYDDPRYISLIKPYSLSAILVEYGNPSEVLIHVDRPEEDSLLQVQTMASLVLLYGEQGFAVEYVHPLSSSDDPQLFCPDQSHVNVFAWDVSSPEGLEGISVHKGSGFGLGRTLLSEYDPLEDLTIINVDQFGGNNSAPCFPLISIR